MSGVTWDASGSWLTSVATSLFVHQPLLITRSSLTGSHSPLPGDVKVSSRRSGRSGRWPSPRGEARREPEKTARSKLSARSRHGNTRRICTQRTYAQDGRRVGGEGTPGALRPCRTVTDWSIMVEIPTDRLPASLLQKA